METIRLLLHSMGRLNPALMQVRKPQILLSGPQRSSLLNQGKGGVIALTTILKGQALEIGLYRFFKPGMS